MHSLVFEMPGRCVSRAVVCCYRTGWIVIVLGTWYAAIFVVVYGPGRVTQGVQRGAVGLGRSRYVLGCNDRQSAPL